MVLLRRPYIDMVRDWHRRIPTSAPDDPRGLDRCLDRPGNMAEFINGDERMTCAHVILAEWIWVVFFR